METPSLTDLVQKAIQSVEAKHAPVIRCRDERFTGWLKRYMLPRLEELAAEENWEKFDEIASALEKYSRTQKEAAAYLLSLDSLERLDLPEGVGEDIRATCLAWLVGEVTHQQIVEQILIRGRNVCLRDESAAVNFWWWLVVDQLEWTRRKEVSLVKGIIEGRTYDPEESRGVLEVLEEVSRLPYAEECFRVEKLKERLCLS